MSRKPSDAGRGDESNSSAAAWGRTGSRGYGLERRAINHQPPSRDFIVEADISFYYLIIKVKR